MSNETSKLKILSIDGGGIKGIIPCVILQAIEERIGRISSSFDLIAGTSTGGIIALGLSKPNPLTMEQLFNIYKTKGNKIFSKRENSKALAVANEAAKMKLDDPAPLFAPFPVDELEALLKENFKDATLSECRNEVLITSYNVEHSEAIYFNSRTADSENDPLLSEVARSTSAAPMFFVPNELSTAERKEMLLIDGGVFANNPAVLAYIEGKEIWKNRKNAHKTASSKDENLKIAPSDDDLPLFMLSIGTGIPMNPSVDYKKSKTWKGYNWINPLLTDIFFNSAAENTEYIIQHLLPDYATGEKRKRYFRLNVPLPLSCMDMSDASEKNVEALEKFGKAFVEDNQALIDEICEYISVT